MRQGLAVCGHMEADVTLIQLMELWSEDYPGHNRWLGDRNYLSHEIVYEMFSIMENILLRKMLANIREAS